MATKKERINAKNEATGMRLVSQFVQEFWECGWQPFDHRNDRGIDGLIIMKKRGNEIGVRINIQVKCGDSYISSHDKNGIRFRFKSKIDLEKHVKYWKKQLEPAILVLVNPGDRLIEKSDTEINSDKLSYQNRLTPEAWWVDLKDKDLKVNDAETLILIPKRQIFNAHSKGDLLKLCRNLIPIDTYPKLMIENEYLSFINGESKPWDFYKSWKGTSKGITYCPAIKSNVIISNTGWKHLTSKHRGKERISFSKRYIGVAKQIIEQVGGFTNHHQSIKNLEFNEFRLGLIAFVETKETPPILVQVILAGREDKITKIKKYWFYSIHALKTKIS